MAENKETSKSRRIDIDHYFLDIADVVACRSTCLRHKIGAVAVVDRQPIATGYSGAPSGLRDCLELGCIRDELKIPSGERIETCRAVHAEINVICQAAVHGTSIKGATIYCTHTPCISCAKALINCHIKRFVARETYDDDAYKDLFNEAGIEFVQLGRDWPKTLYQKEG